MYLYRFPFRVALFVRQRAYGLNYLCYANTYTSPNDSVAIIWNVNGRSRRNDWVPRRANQPIKPLIKPDNNEHQIIWCWWIKFGVNDSSRCATPERNLQFGEK